MAKKFFFVSLGILALAAAFHLGASTVQSQAPDDVVSISAVYPGSGGVNVQAVTTCGDVYVSTDNGSTWYYRANIFGSEPSKIDETTWSRVKAEFK